ncbi:hypothetical protein ABS71_17995 [bacterium SCN 62-11]|nr:heavy-metal-associated domain-containing protein [Candidatus Eremiobacteraeota bacterium]ODT59292.1 MAG: hypothetical protein ABS71_17995 [bacterium SCN 62-11]
MEQTLHIEGMTCQHCQQAAQRALSQVAGVEHVQVDLATRSALVRGAADWKQLQEAVEEAGFTLLPATK